MLSPVLANEVSRPAEDKITFAGDSAYPPFEWLDNGKAKGFNIDLAEQISQAGDIPVEYKLGRWNEVLNALESGEVDAVAMFISEERKKVFRFTTPFYVVSHAIYGQKDRPPVIGVHDLTGFRIAVEKSSIAHGQLINEEFNIDIVLVASTPQALQAVAVGIADFAVLAEPAAEHLITTQNLPLERASPPFWPRDYAFAVRRDRDELFLWLQGALNLAQTSRGYQSVYEKWKSDLHSAGYSSIEVPFYIGYTAIIAFLLMAIFLAWAWHLKRRVGSKAADLDIALDRAKLSETRANFLADYDTETGLPRPLHFSQLVEERLANRPVNSELLIFKLVYLNEVRGTLGQSYSKELIEHISAQLTAKISGPCCYYGRGIFGLFSGRQEIKAFFSTLAINQTDELPYSQYVAGSAWFPEHGMTSEVLLSQADLALSVALSTRKERVVYNPAMAPDPRDLEIISAFRTGSLKGMYAVFQPQVDIKSGEIIGAEALVRWQHPTLGFLSPDAFIPLIETLGFVSQVTELMIDESARIAAAVRREYRPITVSVNVSAHDLSNPDFLTTVERSVERHKCEFSDLKLELTETSFASESANIKDILQELRKLGVSVSIDDFGTGYSSLAYLSMFPVQELKIDRTFVSDMVSNEKNRNIIRSTLVLAEQLNLKTVSEGVENAETLELLRNLGCDSAQGYFVAKPLSEAEFIKFIKKSFA